MDHGERDEAKINPKTRANLLSWLTFFYTKHTFSKGLKKPLNEDDIYQVVENLESKKLGDSLELAWKQETLRAKPSIYRLLWTCYGKTYLMLGLFHLLVRSLVIIYVPKYTENLINYFKPGQTDQTKAEAWQNAAVFIVLHFFSYLYINQYLIYLAEFGIKIRTAFCSLIYRKCLSLGNNVFSVVNIGKIVTLMTKDVTAFEKIVLYANDIWIGFAQAALVCYLIYQKIGFPAYVAIGFFLVVVPVQIYIGKMTMGLRMKAAKKTDERLQIIQEALSAIKIIKIYSWERFFCRKITEARRIEVANIIKIFYTKAIIMLIGGLTSKLAFYLLVMTYIWCGNLIDAGLVYYILTCFSKLRNALTTVIPLGITQAADLNASVQRIGDLLRVQIADDIQPEPIICPKIHLNTVTVDINGLAILKSVNLTIYHGLTVLTGSVGSGKTTLLRTILQEYQPTEGKVLCEGTVSYASQEPWTFRSTIRQNIVFGQKFDKDRYQKVLEACALKRDISNFDEGDLMVVGDGGQNLSKGQRSRINLARAVYRDSNVYLLDDCLSSLDANVRNHIFKECIQHFLCNKLVVLVTKEQNFIGKSDNVIIIEEGRLRMITNSEDMEKLAKDDVEPEEQEHEDEEHHHLLKNIYKEEKRSSKVSKGTYNKYIILGGGYFMLFTVLAAFIFNQASKNYNEKLISVWIDLEEDISHHLKHNLTSTQNYTEMMKAHMLISIQFSSVIVVTTIFTILTAFCLFSFTRRASNRLHDRMISSVIEATMDFFNKTFIGNILNRCSKDFITIDETLPFAVYEFMELFLMFLGVIALIAQVDLIFLVPTMVCFSFLYIIKKIYLPTGRNLQRLTAATRSPVIGYLNSSMEGLSTIKACGVQRLLVEEFDRHQDLHTSTNYMYKCTERAFAFSVDTLCLIYIALMIIIFLIFDQESSVGDVGLVITQSCSLLGNLQLTIRNWAEIENQMTSVERVLEYTDIKIENRTGLTPLNWPLKGGILFNDVSLAYENNKPVLNNINMEIKHGEKIGIVGRTGAGKTSLISCLLRLYPIEGQILIDGLDIKQINLDCLRKSISVIPQDPVLFSGTIRSNIDPTGIYNDDEIWKALNKVKFEVSSLDTEIINGGSNFSAGQRQLICLARSVMASNQILIFDEATANMDDGTDWLISKAIQEHFGHCTILTIAHNLKSIVNSDRIAVMDGGRLVEYDQPKVLTGFKNGVFKLLMETAGLTD